VRRIIPSLLLILALTPVTWLRHDPPEPSYELKVDFRPLPLPSRAEQAAHLGAFHLEEIWQLISPHRQFGGYSALLALGNGELLAIADRNSWLRFTPPGRPRRPLAIGFVRPWQLVERNGYDSESATLDRATGHVWVGWESSNSITRHTLDFGTWHSVFPRAMSGWGRNDGPEAIVRLADGRFIVLREGTTNWIDDSRHSGLLFAGDPIEGKAPRAFTLAGPAGFSVTDMTQIPDGRVLILMRKLVWPFPARFIGRIVIAGPAEIRAGGVWRSKVVAKLSSSLPVDNFEGIGMEPRADGTLTVWLISDANSALTQRTLLWKLAVDPAEL